MLWLDSLFATSSEAVSRPHVIIVTEEQWAQVGFRKGTINEARDYARRHRAHVQIKKQLKPRGLILLAEVFGW